MKIGIDASRAFKKNKTGVEWYANYVINYVINSVAKTDEKNQFVLYVQKNIKDIVLLEGLGPFVKYLRWPFKFLWTQGRLSLEMLFKAPEVLFVPASAMPIIYAKNTVAVIHDVGFMKYPEAYGKWQRIYLKWSTKFAVKHAKKIITISEFSKKEIIKYFTPPAPPLGKGGNILRDKIAVTPLACDTEKFKVINDREKIQNVLDKYNITSPYIFYVGRLEKKKNMSNLIKAYALFREHAVNSEEGNESKLPQLVLAGSKGYGWDEVEELIKKYNLGDDVILTGYVSDEDLPYLYNGADLFLFPSLYEGFGMPILEALACGTPVITSNTGSCPEVGGEAVVYVNPENYEEIAEAIKKVLSDDLLRNMLRNKGLERVKEFSWEKCGKETLEILMN